MLPPLFGDALRAEVNSLSGGHTMSQQRLELVAHGLWRSESKQEEDMENKFVLWSVVIMCLLAFTALAVWAAMYRLQRVGAETRQR